MKHAIERSREQRPVTNHPLMVDDQVRVTIFFSCQPSQFHQG